MAKDRRYVPPEWAKQPASKKLAPRIVEAIARRRRQMLVHSHLYYRMDESVIDDATWTKWAQQLAGLQRKFGWRIGFYDEMFQDWNGSSGHHLPYDREVSLVAQRLLVEHRERMDILG